MQRLREVEASGGAGDANAGRVPEQAPATAGEPRQERGGSPMEAEVSGILDDRRGDTAAEGGAGIGTPAAGETESGIPAGARAQPGATDAGAATVADRLVQLLPTRAGEGDL